MLRRVADDASNRPGGTANFIKNNAGKILQQTILLSNLILPAHIEVEARYSPLKHSDKTGESTDLM